MTRQEETVEEWVERVGQQPIWREVAAMIDKHHLKLAIEAKHFCETLLTDVIKVFSSDVFSLHWLESPQEATVLIRQDVIHHANIVLVHARTEITKKVPEKEQLWRALRSLYEEAKSQKELNVSLYERIAELEMEDD